MPPPGLRSGSGSAAALAAPGTKCNIPPDQSGTMKLVPFHLAFSLTVLLGAAAAPPSPAPATPAAAVPAATYHVANSGNDSHAGSQDAPWQTLQKAASTVRPGDTVIVHPGTYAGFAMGL